MSVIVKGMQMPENCPECRFNKQSGFCSAKPPEFAGYTDDWGKQEWCPLVELPEKHGRLIDADKIVDAMNDMEVEGEVFTTAVNYVKLIVADAPTVIEAEGE